MMTTLTKYMKKTTAIAMAAMVLSLPLASVASAHGRHAATAAFRPLRQA